MTYTIKHLVWQQASLQSFTADTIFGTLDITQDDAGQWRWSYCVDEFYDEGSEECDSAEHGRVAAWHWYLSRLTPALEQTT